MPGWNKLKEVFDDEFSTEKKKPAMMILVITDGEAEDLDLFDHALLKDRQAYVVIALLGYGKSHQEALRSFINVAHKNPHVRLIPFESETDPTKIAQTLLKMIQ
jgi:hypothetical protein